MKITAEDVAQLLASPPPRSVPEQMTKAVLGGGAAWILPLFGAVFGGMGLLFTALFFPWRFQDDWKLAADGAQTTPGVITGVSRTSLSINKTRVMKYAFRYTVAGRPQQGDCYTTGQRWPANAAVTVRYLPGDPAIACVDGARLSEGGGGGLFVLAFPVIGGALIWWFVVDRKRKRQLLRDGLVAEVDVVAVEDTSARVNKQNVYKIVLTSPDLPGGQPVTVRRFDPPEVGLVRKHLEDKQPVFVLYDPRRPKRLIFPEALIDGGS